MNYQFRNEVVNARKAAMGEMYNLAKEHLSDNDKLINFASGHPSIEEFQNEFIKKYLDLAGREFDKDVFRYDGQGYMPLRNSITDFLNQRGDIVKQDDDLLITCGSTEAVFLAASALVGHGDKVIVEVPSYVNAIKAFQVLGAEVIGVHVEDDGVNVEDLENIIKFYRGG